MNRHFESLQPVTIEKSSEDRQYKCNVSFLDLNGANCDVYVIKLDKETGAYRGKPACDPLAPIEC